MNKKGNKDLVEAKKTKEEIGLPTPSGGRKKQRTVNVPERAPRLARTTEWFLQLFPTEMFLDQPFCQTGYIL